MSEGHLNSESKPPLSIVIETAARSAYERVGLANGVAPNEVFHSRNCEQVAEAIDEEFVKAGLKSRKRYGGGWIVTSHEYNAIDLDGKELNIDATWQQFLDEPNPNLPRVLISKRSELEGK